MTKTEPRSAGSGGGREKTTPTELLALADRLERYFSTGEPDDVDPVAELRTLATTLSAREDGWQPAAGWEGVYEAHPCGAVRQHHGKVIGEWTNKQGYSLIRLSDNATGRREMVRTHRLIAQTFVPNPNGLPCVNHIDNNRSNSEARNLEWCTQAENLEHMTKQGRRATPWAGKRSPNAALTDEQAAELRAEHKAGGITHAALAEKYKTSKRTVGKIIKGTSYV